MNTKVARLRSKLMLVVFSIGLVVGNQAWAQTTTIENEEATLVSEFANQGRWVTESRTSKFIIGVYGDSQIQQNFSDFFKDKGARDRKIIVRLVNNSAQANDVNIVYLPLSQKSAIGDNLSNIRGANLLVINEVGKDLFNIRYNERAKNIAFSDEIADIFDKNLTITQLFSRLEVNEEVQATFLPDAEPQEDAEKKAKQTAQLLAKQSKQILALRKQIEAQKLSAKNIDKKLAENKASMQKSKADLQKESKNLKAAQLENEKKLKAIETKNNEIKALEEKLKQQQEELAKANSKKAVVPTKKPQESSNFEMLFYVFVVISIVALLIAFFMWKKASNASGQSGKGADNSNDSLLPIREGQLVKAESTAALGYIATDTTFAVGSYLEDLQAQLESTNDVKSLSMLKPIVALLDTFNNIAADQDETDLQNFDVVAYIKNMMMLYDFEFNQSDISYSYSGETTLKIKSVKSYIALCLLHLINNSLKHAFDNNGNGNISVKVEKGAKGGAKITYSDDGKGMDKNILEQVFNPFFTTRQDRGYIGTGMGCTYDLVKKKLSGDITIDSKVGQGTTVIITLP